MKGKPTRHKESNTFKFESFSDRIAHLDVDVFHRIGHKNEENNEEESYFYQTLQKWNVLNLSECYNEFRKELPCVQTLPLLLNQSNTVIEVILKHLSKNNPLSLQAILELLAALMKDLRHEIYQSYGIVLQKLCDLLSTKNADELEWILTCLAYMFKYLWRYIVKDLETVLESLFPLFSSNKPHYINNFVAGSFAYVARKIKDKRAFVKLVLKALEKQSNCVKGCGHLMFEVVKGVKGHFHSTAVDFIHLLLEMLYDPSIDQKLYCEVLKHMFNAMCSRIDPKHTNLFWTESFSVLNEFYDESDSTLNAVICNLELIKQVVEYKDGLLLSEPSNTITNIIKLLDNVNNQRISSEISSIVAAVLLSQNINLTQENACHMSLKVLNLPFETTIVDFVKKVLEHSGFEIFVLPWVQRYVCKEIKKSLDCSSLSNEHLWSLLAHIILHKTPPCMDGIHLDSWHSYSLDLMTVSKDNPVEKLSVVEILIKRKYFNLHKYTHDNVEILINLCIVLPHIKLAKEETVIKELKCLMSGICSEISSHNFDTVNNSFLQRLLFLFLVSLEAFVHITGIEDLNEICDVQFMVNTILPFAEKSQCISALCAFDLYLTAMVNGGNKYFLSTFEERIYSSLLKNLPSPYHKIRLLTTHTLSILYKENLLNTSYFETCFLSESICVTINNYREKLLYLQRLSCDILGSNNIFKEAILLYLLGVLNINFQLLWEPVMELINSYAREMTVSDFWNVFGCQLKKATEVIQFSGHILPKSEYFNNEHLSEMFNYFHCFDDKPNFLNYRILLWQSFLKFPEICEVKSRDVIPLFFGFLEREYFVTNSENYFSNVKQCDSTSVQEGANGTDLKNTEESSLVNKTLVAHLNVFAKIRNPKAVYKEPLLKEQYLNFLSCKNPNIQKIALDCIMTYKEKFLVPYSSHLYGLLNDKTFKSELVMFQIDKETSIVLEEHRVDLIPVVIRLLHGRMLTKTGRSGPGKASSDVRRSYVLRFFAGCHDNEMLMFLKLTFNIYLSFMQDNPEIIINIINDSLDLCKVISIKRLRSSLNMLLIVLDKFGSLMGEEVLSFVFRMIICIGGYISCILSKKSEVHSDCISGFRSLRNTSLITMTNFFSQFKNYPWSSCDINAVFTVFVWPSVEKLYFEGIHSPTALLKLFAAWSQEPTYFHLLIKCKDNENNVMPLSSIMALLISPKVQKSVTNMIMEMVESLLTTADSVEKSDYQPPSGDQDLSEDLNYGSKILLPYISMVIQYLQSKLSARKKKGLSSRDLLVLSRVCELQVDEEASENLLKLLLHTFLKKVDEPEETVINFVSTICILLKNVSSPFQYMRSLASLFGTVSSIEARKMLCQLLVEVVDKGNVEREILLQNIQVVQDINSWDSKWVEQPNFSGRLNGFKKIHDMIDKGKLHLEMGLVIVHNCFYFLKHEKDLSLRDSSGYCLRKVSPYLCNLSKVSNDLNVPEIILKLIALGIGKKSNETVQHEAIMLLGELVRECFDVHPVLKDMKDLACKDDPEVDFFNNVTHLQSHRRAKALTRFCSVAKKMVQQPRTRTLTQFILPLVSSFLCSEKYSQKRSVIDAAISALSVICKFLSWYHYEILLRYYLQKLRTLPEFQKQLVRIIVSILDGFHFDFSKLKEITSNEKPDVNIVSSETSPKRTALSEASDKNKLLQLEQKNGDDDDDEDEEDDMSSVGDKLDFNTDEEAAEDAESVHCGMLPIDQEPAFLRITKLSPNISSKVIHSITVGLLPQLQRAIGECKSSELAHKVNRKKTAAEQEEEDTMCIPLALAIVKLLQKLPTKYLDRNLPRIFLNICKFLKSRLESVRRVTKEMLQKIMASLGPAYLNTLLNEMTSLLTKGFQIHVLIFTIHSVLSSMKTTFKPGDMDGCLEYILSICKLDLFGIVSEEKDVSKIASKVLEARSHKSYHTLSIAAQYITEKCFVDLLVPLKDVLATNCSHAVLHRVSECLRHIVQGLNDNEFIALDALLTFIHGIVFGKIESLKIENKLKMVKNESTSSKPSRPDIYIIPQAPRTRFGALTSKPSISSDGNAHILIEFAFNLINILLKRGKLNEEYSQKYIDPLVPFLQDNINAKHVKLTTVTLQCLSHILKIELPNIKSNIEAITESLFDLLHKYATVNLSPGEYLDMIVATFKALTVLVRDVKYHVINHNQLRALLLYIEQNMRDSTRQARAFPLLKAILARKLKVGEIGEVMKKVARLSVTSEHDHVRSQARQVFYYYFMNYPLGKKVERHLNFYLSQLSYELESGRLSVLQMLHRIIGTLPTDALSQFAGVCFVALGASLVNDDRSSCKKLCAKCLKTLLIRSECNRGRLWNITLSWLRDEKIAHRHLGVQVCGIFVEVENAKFHQYFDVFLPILKSLLTTNCAAYNESGKFVRIATVQEDETEEIKEMRTKQEDRCTFQILQVIKKICGLCPNFLTDNRMSQDVEYIAEASQNLLGHPHEWIRLEACAILGYVFGSIDIQSLVKAVSYSAYIENRFLFHDTGDKLKSLVLDFCAQLQPDGSGPQLVEQVAKNLIFLSRVLQSLPKNIEISSKEIKVSLIWMIKRMRRVGNMEVVHNPSSYVLREAVFKWIGAMVVDLSKERLSSILYHILTPVARELLNEKESHPDLLRLARGIVKIMKKKVGVEKYASNLAKVQYFLDTRRAIRKKNRAQEVVYNPEVAAKRKIMKQEKKKILKKRKIDEYKGRIAPKRKRISKSNVKVPSKRRVIAES